LGIRGHKPRPLGVADRAAVYVELDYLNPTGFYTYRVAPVMAEYAEQRGNLKQGMTVPESTGGSSGSSPAFDCTLNGYRLRVVSSDAFAVASSA
jgi:cysteine synthase